MRARKWGIIPESEHIQKVINPARLTTGPIFILWQRKERNTKRN